jgi:hypothetical protein
VSFLNPWVWLGALAVGVPIWLHLRSRSGPVFAFPTLRFLEDQPRPRSRGLRLRDLLLFLLRAGAVVLLVAGFARPYTGSGTRIVESRVHVLDSTLSRQAGDGWAKDRDRIAQDLRSGPGDTQDAVVELTARPRVLVSFAEDRAEGARRLQELTPSYARGSYLEALRLAQSLLAQSLGERRRILVYADHQENQWTENETSPPFLEGVDVELVSRPSTLERPNLSVAEPTVRRFFLGENAYVDLAAELRHDGPFRSARLRLSANGKEILTDELAFDRPTGLATLRGQWRSDPTAWVRGEIEIEHADDALAADDKVYFALPPVEEGRVALLARSPFLRAALSPETMKGRWAATRLDPSAPGLAEGPEEALPDVLVLEGDYAQSQSVRKLVLRCLTTGRGVLLFVPRLTPLVKGFLTELGFTAEEARGSAVDAFRLVAGDHPIFRPFLSGELGDILAPHILHHVSLASPQAVPLLFGTSGDALLLEGLSTKGRLLVFAFGADREQTDWPVQPSFVPFLDITLQHARQGTPLQTSAAPGEVVVHQTTPGHKPPHEVVLREGQDERGRAAFDAAGTARVEAPARPGIYALTYDADPAVMALLAVNPRAKESVLRFVADPVAVKAWTLSTTPAAAPVRAALPTLGAADQRWWWWCVLAGAVALALESALVMSRRRGTV